MNEKLPISSHESSKEEKYSVMQLPENRLITEALQRKCQEYKERLDLLTEESPYHTDHLYRIEILETLLRNGSVDAHEVLDELLEKYGNVGVDNYEKAWAIINDYVKTGGKNNVGGTGLN